MVSVAPARRRAARAADARRQDLLGAARRVLANKGLVGATVSDITEAAGVAKGTFYLYFESKEALVGALKRRFADDLVAEASRFFQDVVRDDWWALADATVDAVFDFVLANQDLIQVFAQEGFIAQSRPVFAEADERLAHLFGLAIKAGTQAGVFEAEDPELFGSFLNHAFHGVIEQAILYGRDLDRDRLSVAAKAFIRKALAPGTTQPSGA